MPDAPARRTLHIAPGDSAGGSLRQALISAGLDDGVLAFRDDLSCGPIAPDDPASRANWWGYEETGLVRDAFVSFWDAVDTMSDRLVVWYARHSALELAFFLSWSNRLGDRPYEVIDVTGRRLPYRDRDRRSKTTPPLVAVGITPTDALHKLFGTERTPTSDERHASRDMWRRLKSENAPFRIVTEAGLVSAPEDHFDADLLDCAGPEWQKMARVVGECMSRNWEPFIQVGDRMLHDRIIALVEDGRLIADGDPTDMRACLIRSPV